MTLMISHKKEDGEIMKDNTFEKWLKGCFQGNVIRGREAPGEKIKDDTTGKNSESESEVKVAVIQSDEESLTKDEEILDLKLQLKEQKDHMKNVSWMLITKASIDDGAVTPCKLSLAETLAREQNQQVQKN